MSIKTLHFVFQIQFDSQHEPDSRAITGIANFFDYGAMLGGVVAGFLSDQTRGKFKLSPWLVLIFQFRFERIDLCHPSASCYSTDVHLQLPAEVTKPGLAALAPGPGYKTLL